MNRSPQPHRYMLEYLDFTDSTRYCSFTAQSDAEALVYARRVCREARQEFVSRISEDNLGFRLVIRKRWYVVNKLVDIDETRTILPRTAERP